MAETVELEGATQARQAGTKITLAADTPLKVGDAGVRRKALYLRNNEESETIFVRFAEDGASATAGIPLKAGEGLVIKDYFGAVSLYSTNGATEVFKAEF